MSELQVENVRPVTPDREALEAISAAIHIRGEQVMQVQHELLEAQKQQDLMDEQEFYAQVHINSVLSFHTHDVCDEVTCCNFKHILYQVIQGLPVIKNQLVDSIII